MKFKICQNSNHASGEALKINILPDNKYSTQDIVSVPDEPNGHVMYPIPSGLEPQVQEYLNSIIKQEKHDLFNRYETKINEIIQERKQEMLKLRKELNPKLLEKLKEFQNEHPEYFL